LKRETAEVSRSQLKDPHGQNFVPGCHNHVSGLRIRLTMVVELDDSYGSTRSRRQFNGTEKRELLARPPEVLGFRFSAYMCDKESEEDNHKD